MKGCFHGFNRVKNWQEGLGYKKKIIVIEKLSSEMIHAALILTKFACLQE
jgi:hypothetical protein